MKNFQDKPCRNLNKIYVLFYIFLIFCLSRGYYFLLSDYQLASMVYDSTWWLSLENIINNPVLQDDEYYKIRIDTRIPIEIILHKVILEISNFFNFSQLKTNLYITSSIYMMFIYTAFYLGKKELKSSSLGLLYSFCCIQTAYSVWLSFPVFVPKIIGFTLYPLALYALTTRKEKTNYYYAFFLALWALFYPISLIYCLPSIIVGAGLYYYFFKDNYRALNLPLLLTTLIVLVISMSASFFLIKSYPATSAEIFSIFYGSYSNSLILILNYYSFYFLYLIMFLFCFVTDYFFKIIKNKNVYLYMFIATASITSSLVCYVFQNHVSFFRTTWFWRSVFYSNIPAMMCLFLYFKEILPYIFSKKYKVQLLKNKEYIAFLLVVFFISILCTFNNYFTSSLNIFKISNKIQDIYYQKDKEIEIEEDFFKITQILKKTSGNYRLLMPPLELQSGFSDTIEAYIPWVCLLSRGDSYHFIFQTNLTNHYLEKNEIYNQILKKSSDDFDLSKKLYTFMKDLNVDVILLPRKITIDSPLFHPLYLGFKWGLYTLNESTREGASPLTSSR